MTKVQLQFKVGKLDEVAMFRLADITSIYGILKVTFNAPAGNPPTSLLTIEYDASRLMEKDVEAVLARAGIPAEPVL